MLRKIIKILMIVTLFTCVPASECFIPTAEAQKKTTRNRRSKNTKNTKVSNTKKTTENPSKAQTSQDVRKLQEATQKEIRQTEEQIKENERSVKNGLKELGKIEGEISESKKKISVIAGKINELNIKIGGLEKSISENESELEKLRAEYLKAVKKMRAANKNNSELAFIFSSGSFNQAMRRMRYLKEFSEWKDRQSDAISGKLSELKTQKEDLDKTKEQQALVLEKQQKEQTVLSNQYARQDALLTDLRKNGEALKSHLASKQKEANELKNRISALIAEEQRKAEEQRRTEEKRLAEERRKAEEERRAEETRKTEQEQLLASQTPKKQEDKKEKKKEKKEKKESRSANYADARKRKPRSGSETSNTAPVASTTKIEKEASSFEAMKGRLPSPVSSPFKVTSGFGQQSLPDLPDVMYDNPGIDAEVAAGASAKSVYAGKVSGVYKLPGYNTVIIVNHGNYYTVYGNIDNPAVKVGDAVSTGQGLGTLAPEEDDPNHGSIHFEVWKNREKLNPLDWIRN